MNFDLNLLTVFDKIYTTRNLTKAAETLGLTQSAVSQALGRLRLHFEDELFFRVPHGMEPTARAHGIASHTTAALNSAEQAFQVVKEFDPRVSDESFNIGLLDIDVVFLGPKLVNHFQKCAPHIQLKIIPIRPSIYAEQLDQGEMHIAINIVEKKLPKRFSTSMLFDDEHVVIAKTKHPHIKKTLTLNEFLLLPQVGVDWFGYDGKYVDPIFNRKGMKRKIAITVKEILGVPFVVKQTDLIATVPLTLMEYYADLKGLEMHACPFKIPSCSLSLIWHQRINGNQAYEWIIEQIQEVCGKMTINRKHILT